MRRSRYLYHASRLIAAAVASLCVTILWGAPALAAINSMNLGSRYDASGNITFRVYSSRATRIDLYLYKQATGADEVHTPYQLNKDPSSLVWSVTVPAADLQAAGLTGAGVTVYYGYRAWGPNWTHDAAWTKGSDHGFVVDVDANGNRFNPNKLLLDPYALEVSQDPVNTSQLNGSIYNSGATSRDQDDGRQAPKGIVLPNSTGDTGTKPTGPQKDDIIYEVHVRGLTKQDPSIPAPLQGTYQGAALKAQYLADLGVTAVEFLPIHETDNDINDADPSQANYWGYSTLNYFAPDRRYSSDQTPGGPTREFQAMVKTYHDLGIKVYVDVVYGHTWEGGLKLGNAGDPAVQPILSWRGLDNPTYYSLAASDPRYSVDKTGCCGGDFNADNPVAQNLIVDSLAYYRDVLGVDGFRFDQAPILANACEPGCYSFSPTTANTATERILADIPPRDAMGKGTDLIAEPFAADISVATAGGFPPGWSEWDDNYRDTIKKSQNELGNVAITPGNLADVFAGSHDRFQPNGRFPWNSINYLVSHDEPTLIDDYSCNMGDKNAWDQGGNVTDQRQAARNGFALLMLTAGTPMLGGGDEFLRSLHCTPNPYNIDTSLNWLNYAWSADQITFNTFAKRLIAFRKAHPSLRPANFFSGQVNGVSGMKDITWFKSDGTEPVTGDTWWNEPTQADLNQTKNDPSHFAMAYRIDGTGFNDPSSAIYVAYNGWWDDVTFKLPDPGIGKIWWRVMDTATWNEGPDTVVLPGHETCIGGLSTTYVMHGRTVLLLTARGADFYVRDWTDSSSSHDPGDEPSTHPDFFDTSDVWNQINSTPYPFNNDQPVGDLPQEGPGNVAFARISRTCNGTTEKVAARFLYSDYGAGNNFVILGNANPVQFGQSDPQEITSLPWTLPMGHSQHVCLAVEISTTDDPVKSPSLEDGWLPGPSDSLVRADNNKAQRNIIFPPAPMPPPGPFPIFHPPPPLRFYAIVHNATASTSDMKLKCDATPEVRRRLRGARIEIIGEPRQRYNIGDTVTLAEMKPGENRWLGLAVNQPSSGTNQPLPVVFTEIAGKKSINGFAIAVQPSPLSTVIRDNLGFYRATLVRLSATNDIEQAAERIAATTRLLHEETNFAPAYVALLRSQFPLIAADSDRLLRSGRLGDPFDLKSTMTAFKKALDRGDPATCAVAHSALLNKLDAFLTMIQKSGGDPADIGQNVYWQSVLYARMPRLKRVSGAVIESSRQFISSYEAQKSGEQEYMALIRSLLGTFRETSKSLASAHVALQPEIDAMEQHLDSPAALQKAHRNYLLKLQQVADDGN